MTLNSITSWRPGRISISTWFVATRLTQALLSLGTAVLNGALLVYLYQRGQDFDHGDSFGRNTCNLEIMICVAFAYSSFVLLFLHTGKRRRNPSRGMLMGFVFADILFVGLLLIALTLLGRVGLPLECGWTGGDAKDLSNEDESDDDKKYPHWGARSSEEEQSESDSQRLQHYAMRFCGVEKTFYSLIFILIYTYIATIALGILRMCEQFYYTHNSEVGNILARREDHEFQQVRAKIKVQDSAPTSPVVGAGMTSGATTRTNLAPSPVSPSSASQQQFHSIPSPSSANANNLPYQQHYQSAAAIASARTLTNQNNNCPVSPVSPGGGVSPIGIFPSPSSASSRFSSVSSPQSSTWNNNSNTIPTSCSSSTSPPPSNMGQGAQQLNNLGFYQATTDSKADLYRMQQQQQQQQQSNINNPITTQHQQQKNTNRNSNNPLLFVHPDGTTHNPADDEEAVNAAMVTDGGYVPGGMIQGGQGQGQSQVVHQQQQQRPSPVAMMMMRDRYHETPSGAASVISGSTFLPPYTPRRE